MRGHVEEKKVSLLGAEDALVDESLGEALADLFELVADLEYVPRLACYGMVSIFVANQRIRDDEEVRNERTYRKGDQSTS